MLRLSGALGAIGLAILLLSTVLGSAAPQGVNGEPITPSPTADAAGGKALFAAKGCASCHVHRALSGRRGPPEGPDLTNYRADPTFLQRWLADPGKVKPGTRMPNLDLSDAEIADLIAFLNARP